MKRHLPTVLPVRNLTMKEWKNMSTSEIVSWWEKRWGLTPTKEEREKLFRIFGARAFRLRGE